MGRSAASIRGGFACSCLNRCCLIARGHGKSGGASLPTVTTAGAADCNKMDCQMQNAHSEEHPAPRRNMCGVDYFCQVHAETQQGNASALAIRCPLNPLMNTGTPISLTSAPPLSSDSQAKPAIGRKSAKRNPTVLNFWTARGRKDNSEGTKGAGRGPESRSTSFGHSQLASRCNNCCCWTLRSTIGGGRNVGEIK